MKYMVKIDNLTSKVYLKCKIPFKFKYKRRRNKKEYAIRVKYNYIRNITFVPIFL